jgi:uncharacterized protein (DUF111 family)
MADLAAVLPAEAGRPELTETRRGGFAARHFALTDASESRPAELQTYPKFRKRLEGAHLSDGTAARACDILHRLARAEAAVHGLPLERVHFHEIADWDALMDVVAAGSLVAALGARWSVSPLPLGGGLVKTEHGKLPVPTPATLHLLEGFDWRDDGIGGERITPTGAAILASIMDGAGNGTRPGGRLVAHGNGAGTRQMEGIANLLRVTIFEAGKGAGAERLGLLSFEIDDMTGEEIALAADRLRACKGLRDLLLIPAQGKKGRPVTRIEIQADPAALDTLTRAVFHETSTLGVRRSDVLRQVVPRAEEIAPSGRRRKRAQRPEGEETLKVESDELRETSGLAARRRKARKDEE